jgi:coenzyme F420-reducing hydrogenase beta subunit
MQKSVADIKDCYGCGVCVAACPRRVLELRHDKNGFYAPMMVNEKACTDCGICRNVCSYVDDALAVNQSVQEWHAMWSKDAEVRSNCSSGGVAYELAKKAIEEGYVVVGVRYNAEKHRAEHCLCETVEKLKATRGSKYIQSFTTEAFAQLDRKKKYMVVGTPCQIDSMRRWIRQRKIEDNFVLVDFFCHGVPSYWVWEKYVKENIQGDNFTDVAFRSKTNVKTGGPIPWHDSFVVTAESREYALQPNINKRDWFYHYFLEDLSLGVACYEKCKFKMYASSADIRIGDAWGSAYEKNEEGVSAVLTFTDKGKAWLDKCENLKKEDITIDLLCEDQMPESPKMPSYYRLRLWLVKHTPFSLHQVNRLINGLMHYVKK